MVLCRSEVGRDFFKVNRGSLQRDAVTEVCGIRGRTVSVRDEPTRTFGDGVSI